MFHTKCAIADSNQYGPVLSGTYVQVSSPVPSEVNCTSMNEVVLD